ncbi:hypothetical protein L1987_13228 [Smallanthus sonchifolius]|uniref:Uncharacterized protein n=1 Tax=Smallanthus sonchifolius TaxID=185202 RepID=A0ACB9JGC0_9ASTR|nr:hypothetical protein L1987_13228 [Smallanthus sonchifolius]
MPPYEMLYGRRCRTPVCWGEIGQKELGSLEVIKETSERFDQIKARMKAAQDRQKSYADRRRRPIEFDVGDIVMLKVSPWKGIIRFRKRGKLSSRFVGPFRIMARVGEVAYRLELPDELSGIHPTFHVSHLRKCLADESVHVPLTDIEVDNSLNYIEEPVAILDQKEKRLRNKVIQLVKVQWKHRKGSEATWKTEAEMRESYPQLFDLSEVTLLDLRLGQPILAYQRAIVATRTTGALSLWHVNGYDVVQLNEMARRGNGRRGGGTGGRTGGRNGGRGRIPARQEHSEEGSVHTEPTVSVHGTEQTQVAEQPFTFEPEVRAAIAREFSELMKNSLPSLLAEALKKVSGEGGSSAATGAQNNETDNAPPARGCDYKSFKACDPPVLTVKKDAVATFDWVIRMEAAIRLSECRANQVVKFAANSLREEASHWWEGVR